MHIVSIKYFFPFVRRIDKVIASAENKRNFSQMNSHDNHMVIKEASLQLLSRGLVKIRMRIFCLCRVDFFT